MKMSINHTPGPWVIVPTLTGALSINVAPTVPVATVGGSAWHLGKEVATANAHLIAAAPDMLAAHQENARLLSLVIHDLQGRIDGGKLAALQQCVDRSRAAIAKATGKTNA
jgi:hypothetical protein